jgi:hypothetical protein
MAEEKICPLSLASEVVEKCRKEECQWWMGFGVKTQGKKIDVHDCAIVLLAINSGDLPEIRG